MKATTAYFLFAEEQRAAVREQILAERGEGGKASVCEVAKAIGQRWKELGDEQKEVLKQVCGRAMMAIWHASFRYCIQVRY